MSDDDQKMYRYARFEEPFRESLIQHATSANILALAVWLGWTYIEQRVVLTVWLWMLAAAGTLSFAGWAAQKIWYRWAGRLERPFGLKAYGSRIPITFLSGGIFGLLLWFSLSKPLTGSPMNVFLLCGSMSVIMEWPLQWSEFNRLRKICLTNL